MRHLSSFMQNEVVLALGWTLIHSLWQGLLLALVTGIMLLATRRSSAQKRYELLTGLFLLFIAVTGMTFARELYLAIARPGYRPLANIAAGRSVISSIIPFTDSHIVVNRSWAFRLKQYFNQNAYLIVIIWFIIFMARFIKLIAELAYIERLKSYRTSQPPQAWKNRLEELIQKMHINKYVQLLESGIVKVPMVMGILKPVILLPLGLLAQLPADEIEAILLHELAHIQRRDYFVNLVQSFAETLFFFNPALMWLSSLIREERENCCDDIAIGVTNNKTKFIDALISFQEFDLAKPGMSMGFPGKKHQLLNRVKRILSKRNKTLNTTEKSILTLSMAILIMLSFVAAKNIPVSKLRKKLSFNSAPAVIVPVSKQDDKLTELPPAREKAETISSFLPTGVYTPVLHQSIDTSPVQKQLTGSASLQQGSDSVGDFKSYSTDISDNGSTITLTILATHRYGTQYRLKKINDQIIEFSVNGKAIPESEFRNYQATIDAIERPYDAKKTKQQVDKERARLRHESDVNRQKIAELNKETERVKREGNRKSVVVKRVLINNRWVLEGSDTLTMQDYLQKQQELDSKLSALDRLKENEEAEAKKERLKTLNDDMKRIDLSISEIDAIVKASQQKKGDLQKTKPDFVKSDLAVKSKADLKRKAEAETLRKKTEDLKRELLRTEEKLSRLQKDEPGKKKLQNGAANFKVQSDIRKLIAELPDVFYVVVPNTAFNQLFNNGFALAGQDGLEIEQSKGISSVVFRHTGEYTLQFTDKRTGADNLVFEKKVQVKAFPPPIVKHSGVSHDDIANAKELLSGQMVAYSVFPGSNIGFPGRVNGFRITKISKSVKQESFYNYSGILQGGATELINKTQKGDVILFDNILVSLSDGTTRSVNPMTYKITDP